MPEVFHAEMSPAFYSSVRSANLQESDQATVSEGGEPLEMDATSQFYEEVVESMERIQGFTFSNQQVVVFYIFSPLLFSRMSRSCSESIRKQTSLVYSQQL